MTEGDKKVKDEKVRRVLNGAKRGNVIMKQHIGDEQWEGVNEIGEVLRGSFSISCAVVDRC